MLFSFPLSLFLGGFGFLLCLLNPLQKSPCEVLEDEGGLRLLFFLFLPLRCNPGMALLGGCGLTADSFLFLLEKHTVCSV